MAKLILVGGFLGSGKTTLLKQVARCLSQRGKSVGTIVNDQAAGLVDTALLCGCGCGAKEVSGGCFCCNFDAFEEAVLSLIELGAEIIVAEPVGSCTDLAATILRPFKDRHPEIETAPFTVLVSPDRVREALGECESPMHPGALYILRLQMAEADRISLNKIDLLDAGEQAELIQLLRDSFPEKEIGGLSARAGDGVDDWTAGILVTGGDAGFHLVDVDYDRYAEGEAALGWLNAVIHLQAVASDVDFLASAVALMESLHGTFRERRAPIGHIKVVIESGGAQRVANLTSLDGGVMLPDETPLRGAEATLILNARVQAPAEALDAVTQCAIAGLSGQTVRASTREFRCLTPGKPHPTYRYPAVASRSGACEQQ